MSTKVASYPGTSVENIGELVLNARSCSVQMRWSALDNSASMVLDGKAIQSRYNYECE